MENRANTTSRTPSGPYRATKLWNEITEAFRAGVPRGRHRRYMRTYEDCFSASNATDWLHDYLKNSPNFGKSVTRAQTVQLLQKLYKARLFIDVSTSKHTRGQLTDNGQLYRFHTSSVSSVSPCSRVPLSCRPDLVNHHLQDTTRADSLHITKNPQSSCHGDMKLEECHLVAKPVTARDAEESWINLTVDRLKTILDVGALDDILDSSLISGKNIMHNCSFVNKNGIVTCIDPKEQLPPWALSAMKCLARWPEKFDDKLPSYPGFEKDVFRVVKDYFYAQQEPLLTYDLFEVITNIFIATVQPTSIARRNSESTKSVSFKSVENLLLDLTSENLLSNFSIPTKDCLTRNHLSVSTMNLSPIQPNDADTNLHRSQSLSHGLLDIQTRYETAFGPENQTVTRIYYVDGSSADLEFNNCRMLVENPYTSSPKPMDLIENTNHCQSTYGVNFARVRSIRNNRSTSDSQCTSNIVKPTYGCAIAVVRPRYNSSNVCEEETNSYHSANTSLLSDKSTYRTPPSRTDQCISLCSSSVIDPPKYKYPPSYDAVFPSGGNKSRRHRSLSGPSIPKCLDEESPEALNLCSVGNSITQLQRSMKDAHDVVPYRSVSTSDLTRDSAFTSNLAPKDTNCSTKSLYAENEIERTIQALKILCLFLPPSNRRKLQLLMRLLNKMVNNSKLCLDGSQSTRSLVLETFCRSVLRSQDETEMDDVLVKHVVSFIMDNHLEILSAPEDLKKCVEDHMHRMKTQIVYSSPTLLQYCQKVSKDDYEKQKLSSSQQALVSLLDEIISNPVMSHKDKKKRLKQFQKSYPDLYCRRFPNKKLEAGAMLEKPKIKPPLLVKPLLKLKGLRI
ncbi:hypothetical protein ScPMuIL_005465 [Solemya velum]